MADTDPITVTIAFKDDAAPPATYRVQRAVLEKLTREFTTEYFGVYEAQTERGHPVVLALRFSDVLYIG